MTYNDMWRQLAPGYGDGEAKAVSRMVYEVRYGLTLSDLLLGKDTQLSADSQAELEEIALRLARFEPVQYVLGQADFCGRTFVVSPAVLIPRPETEELCRWVAADVAGVGRERGGVGLERGGVELERVRVLDVGTGSGCIAVTLAAELPEARVTAWDISADALEVAAENAKRAGVHVSFSLQDIFHAVQADDHAAPAVACPVATAEAPQWDVIVSNPPYICHKERTQMDANVLEYEPHGALFVPDDDPLLFYRAVGAYGLSALQPGGRLYFEINPLYATDLVGLLGGMSYRDIGLRQDAYGKNRFIRATR